MFVSFLTAIGSIKLTSFVDVNTLKLSIVLFSDRAIESFDRLAGNLLILAKAKSPLLKVAFTPVRLLATELAE